MSDSELLAVMRTSEMPIPTATLAALVAPVCGGVLGDVSLRLNRYPNWLVRKAPPEIAKHVLKACIEANVAAEIVGENQIIEPPEVVPAARLEPQPTGFFVLTKRQPLFIKWSELIAIEAYESGQETTQEVTAPEMDVIPGAHPDAYRAHRPTPTRKAMKVAWHPRAELVCFDPWLVLRIDAETFPFASCGLPVAASRQLSLVTLLKTILERAPHADAHFAIIQAQPGKAMGLPRLLSSFPYTPNLAWRLTRIFRDAARGNGPLAGRVPVAT
jgi:hypothetical protein